MCFLFVWKSGRQPSPENRMPNSIFYWYLTWRARRRRRRLAGCCCDERIVDPSAPDPPPIPSGAKEMERVHLSASYPLPNIRPSPSLFFCFCRPAATSKDTDSLLLLLLLLQYRMRLLMYSAFLSSHRVRQRIDFHFSFFLTTPVCALLTNIDPVRKKTEYKRRLIHVFALRSIFIMTKGWKCYLPSDFLDKVPRPLLLSKELISFLYWRFIHAATNTK